MDTSNLFYGFRGLIIFPDQRSIYNLNLKNDSESKNKIFREFFSTLEIDKKLESYYQKRVYYLIFKNKYDNVFHCQLARRKEYNKRELVENIIVEKEDDDYPYVNVFVDLKSQKFLIESNTQVFENYNTCEKVLGNIMNSNLKQKDIEISITPITEMEEFWGYFTGDTKVYSIDLKLIVPNIFDAEDDADKLLNGAKENIGSDIVNLGFRNSKGELRPLKKD